MIWLFLAALAQAEPRSVYVDTGKSAQATAPSWLVPESYFDRCLIQGRELQIVYKALDACIEKGLGGLAVCDEVLVTAEEALLTCEGRMITDASELGAALAQAAVLTEQNADLRRQRNRAVGISIAAVAVTAAIGGLTLAR